MSEFINTIDILGDDEVMDGLIDKSITEFKDDEITKISNYAFYGCTSLTDIDLPNATSMSDNAFAGCTSLEEINLPNIAGALGGYAFDNCTNLKSVNLPGVITSTGSGFFKNCASLTNINLPNTENIGAWFVQNCPVEVLDFPKLKSTGQQSFLNTFSLVAVILRRTDAVCTAGTGLFDSNQTNKQTTVTAGTGYIYVPRAFIEDYKVATNWSTYASQFRAIEDFTVDGTVTGEMREHCESLALDVTKLTFTDANRQTLTPTGALGILDPVIWESSDKRVAAVKNGVVTPFNDGTAVITVTCGDYSATCTVTVNAGLELTNILYDIGFNSGYLDGNSGTAKSATSDLYTDKFDISIYAGNSINVQLTNVTGTAANSRICYYTTDNTFISSVNGVSGGSGIVNMTSTVPSNAAYVSISIAKNNNFSITITIDGVLIGEVEYTS